MCSLKCVVIVINRLFIVFKLNNYCNSRIYVCWLVFFSMYRFPFSLSRRKGWVIRCSLFGCVLLFSSLLYICILLRSIYVWFFFIYRVFAEQFFFLLLFLVSRYMFNCLLMMLARSHNSTRMYQIQFMHTHWRNEKENTPTDIYISIYFFFFLVIRTWKSFEETKQHT